MREKVSIILPTYNESGNIVDLINSILKNIPDSFNYEIIVVDDSSPDDTYLKVKKYFLNNTNIVPIIRTKKRGLAYSIRKGIEDSLGDYIIVMDTDFTHDPSEIPKMLHMAKIYDVISCSRFCAGGKAQNKFNYITSLFFNWFLRIVIHTQIQDNLAGYFLIKKNKVKELPLDPIFYGYGDYFFRLLSLSQIAGFSILEIPTQYKIRNAGESKSKIINMIFNYTRAAIYFRFNKKKFEKKYFKKF